MKVAIRAELPSPESALLLRHLSKGFEVTEAWPWSAGILGTDFDLVVCLGPVKWRPEAARSVLLVLGPTDLHVDLGWDAVVVTSRAAVLKSKMMFGWGARVFLRPPPLLDLLSGRNRLVAGAGVALHASPCPIAGLGVRMALWGGYEGGALFSSREFNSLAGNGAFGVYAGMADGYDVQVRRHLAFGSPVVCNQDRDVIGDLADLCVQNEGEIVRVERVTDGVRERDYLESLDEIIRML